MTSPKLVYLDHSVVAHEPSWPAIKTLFKDAQYRLGLSVWSLLEVAGATDRAQRAARISLIEECNPLWLLDHVYVRKQEVKRFLWPRRFNTPSPDLDYVTPRLSHAESIYAGSKTRIGLTISVLVNDLARIDVSKQKKLSPRALAFLQQVPKKEWRRRQGDIFTAVMTSVIPELDPSGRPLRKTEQTELIAYCWNNRDELMSACPTIVIDDALCEARISDPKRPPRESDGIDLAHAVMALGYCDYFIVRDGYVAACAKQSEMRLSQIKIARVVSSPTDVLRTSRRSK
jgi:hypothetical protein